MTKAWPLLEPTDLVGDLWEVPAYLRMCAPWLEPDDVRSCSAQNAAGLDLSDLPLLDAARLRLGDPEASRRKRRHDAAVAAERARMDRVVDDLLQPTTTRGMMAQLRQEASATPWSTRARSPRPTRTCSPDRSRTSSWTRPRS